VTLCIMLTKGIGHEGLKYSSGRVMTLWEVISIATVQYQGVRTTTSVHANDGNDIMSVKLIEEENENALFVANGQNGDDTIDCTLSSLGVLLFGGLGDDTLVSGSGNDVVFGDQGLVRCKCYSLTVAPIQHEVAHFF